mmetsp:Transcript_28031/g.82428  ORF Transcript_28031/g.82428 Transcript_28031/m.82428 type:complete len:91 (+) Transcript_28031:493-765(+)
MTIRSHSSLVFYPNRQDRSAFMYFFYQAPVAETYGGLILADRDVLDEVVVVTVSSGTSPYFPPKPPIKYMVSNTAAATSIATTISTLPSK